MPISFSPVNYGEQPKTTLQSALSAVDWYFSPLAKHQYQALPGFESLGKQALIQTAKEKTSFFSTVLKVASYFTVLLPLLLLIAKVVLHLTQSFVVIQEKEVPHTVGLELLSRAGKNDKLNHEELKVVNYDYIHESELEDQLFRAGSSVKETKERVGAIPVNELPEILNNWNVPIEEFLSEEQFKQLPLSKLDSSEIERLFPKENVKSRIRFALLSREEVQKALYEKSIPNDWYSLIHRDQLIGIDRTKLSEEQVESLNFD